MLVAPVVSPEVEVPADEELKLASFKPELLAAVVPGVCATLSLEDELSVVSAALVELPLGVGVSLLDLELVSPVEVVPVEKPTPSEELLAVLDKTGGVVVSVEPPPVPLPFCDVLEIAVDVFGSSAELEDCTPVETVDRDEALVESDPVSVTEVFSGLSVDA